MLKKKIIKQILIGNFITLYSFFGLPFIPSSFANNPPTEICIQDLEKEINNLINQPSNQGENWGIMIKNLENKNILYQLNSEQNLIPASNNKLITTASILLAKGEDFTINTPVYIKGNPPNIDSLIILGKGDPSITTEDLLIIPKKLKENNISNIKNIQLIENKLFQPVFNYSWEYSDIFYFFAVPVSSFILDQNTVSLNYKPAKIGEKVSLTWSNNLAGKQWLVENTAVTGGENSQNTIDLKKQGLGVNIKTIGSFPVNNTPNQWRLSIPEPTLYFRDSLLEILKKNQITVEKIEINENEDQINLNELNLLVEFISPSLKELVTVANKDSNNLYAEVLFKYLSENNFQEQSLQKVLKDAGLDGNYRLKDGSGLSRQNIVSAKIIVDLLELMNQGKYGETFRNSLSVAGVNGTLKNRFQDTNIVGNLYGKTGTLTGVSALSGYLKPNSYDTIAFSIIVNNSFATNQELRGKIDELILILGRVKTCNL